MLASEKRTSLHKEVSFSCYQWRRLDSNPWPLLMSLVFFHCVTAAGNALAYSGNPNWRGRISTINLLVLTSSDHLLFILKLDHSFYKTTTGGQLYRAFRFSKGSLAYYTDDDKYSFITSTIERCRYSGFQGLTSGSRSHCRTSSRPSSRTSSNTRSPAVPSNFSSSLSLKKSWK